MVMLAIALGAVSNQPPSAHAQVVCDDAGGGGAAGATATGVDATACGPNATADGRRSVAIGQSSSSGGDDSISIGDSSAGAIQTIAIGTTANASASTAIAIGRNATASDAAAIAIGGGINGFQAQATGQLSIAIGNGSSATTDGAVAIGGTNSGTTVASGTDALALQGGAAGGTSSIALGAGATVQAGHDNSVALGAGAQSTRANQVMVGTAATTYTMPGITSSASKAAQGPVHGVVTTDANGNLASDGGALHRQVEGNTEGVAMAMALAGGLNLPEGKNFGISGNWGTFDGEHAMGFGAVGRVSKNVYLNGGVGIGAGHGKVGGRAGVMFTW